MGATSFICNFSKNNQSLEVELLEVVLEVPVSVGSGAGVAEAEGAGVSEGEALGLGEGCARQVCTAL